MSIYTGLLGAAIVRKKAASKWVQRFTNDMTIVTEAGIRAATINEGDAVAFTLQVLNWRVGSRMIVWMANNAPGTSGSGLVADGNWLRPWLTVFSDALIPAGISVQKLTATTTPRILGQFAMLLTVTDKYAGQAVTLANSVRRNRTTEKAQPRYAQLLLQSKVATTDPDTTGIAGGNILRVRDTSQSPAGAPTLAMRNFDVDGVSPAKATLYPGDGMQLRLDTANMLAGTKVKLYIANDAQGKFTPGFRAGLIARLKEGHPGIGYETTPFPPPVGEVYYQGATIVFGDDYNDADPFTFTFTAGNQITEADGALQFDVIAQVVKEGTAADFEQVQLRGDWNSTATYVAGDVVVYVTDGGRYILTEGTSKGTAPTADPWRLYVPTQVLRGSFSGAVKARPPRYWEVRATSDGATITYTVNVPAAPGDTVRLVSDGVEPAGYAAARDQAFAAAADIATIAGDVVTARTSAVQQAVSWTVPHPAGVAGKHGLTLVDPTGPSFVVIGEACVYLTRAALPDDPTFVTGVNLAGGEFGSADRYGTDYRYPSRPENADPTQRHLVMNYHWSKGARIIRLPFDWRRFQPTIFAAISPIERPKPLTAGTAADGYRIDEIIAYWTGLGGIVLLDLHNYGNGPAGGKIGYDKDVQPAALADIWVQIATRYADNRRVWFGLMNEPNGGAAWSPSRTRDTFQLVVNAIRRRTSALNKILIAATEYSSARNFVSNGQAEAFQTLYDPAGNAAIELHCYFDTDASGTTGVCVVGGQSRLAAATAWQKAAPGRLRLFLGETAGGDPTVSGQQACGSVMPATYKYLTDNQDAWLGFTVWGGGDRWPGNYPFMLEPTGGYADPVDRETMKLLAPYLKLLP